MPIVVGLTGNIACGKSLVGEILKERGIPVLDSDELVYEVYRDDEKAKEQIRQDFGTLDRKEIAKQIFGDSKEAKEKRKRLEEIIHPIVDGKFREWVRANNGKKILVNLVPLVFEVGLESRYNYIVTVTSTEELQKKRLRLRDPSFTEEDIDKRIKSQMPQNLKVERSDFIIKNTASIEDLYEQIDEILEQISQV